MIIIISAIPVCDFLWQEKLWLKVTTLPWSWSGMDHYQWSGIDHYHAAIQPQCHATEIR